MKTRIIESPANTKPIDDFLGLTPAHLRVLVYSPLDQMQHIVQFNSSFDSSLLAEVDVVKRVTLLIKLIGEAGEAKATQNGNLPRKIVNALFDFGELDQFTVPTEEYSPSVMAIRHAVTNCGWLKKRAGRFSLTKSGEKIFQNGFSPLHYMALLKYWIRDYNWGFADGASACSIVQQSAVFSLYLLMKQAQEPLSAENFTRLFIRAFPFALEELSAETNLYQRPAEEKLGFILRMRFLERFVAYFGLIDYLVDEKLPYSARDKEAHVKTTRLFKEVFHWFPHDRQKFMALGHPGKDDLIH